MDSLLRKNFWVVVLFVIISLVLIYDFLNVDIEVKVWI